MYVGQIEKGFVLTLGFLGIWVSLLTVEAVVRFTHHPPSVLYVQKGQTARFVWDYTVDNRNTEFGLNSPEWRFYDSQNRKSVIGTEDGLNGWQWAISNQCPARLLNPTVRVSKESTATLVISNATTADNGVYGCTLVLSSGDPIGSKIQLIVTVSPQFNPQPPLTKNIAEGQELNVPCTAIGPPTPNITWVQIAGHVLKSTGTGSATLRVPNIRRDQNGKYECQAWNNPNENPVTAQTVISVYYPPKSTVTSPSIIVVQGDEIVLSCTADGYPPPSISWTKVDGIIKAGHTVAGGTLRIPDAIKTDAGKYICTAKNTYDSREHSDNATATVVVKYQPFIILEKLKNQTIDQSDSLSIKCDADGYPPPTIKWKTPRGSVHTGNVYNVPSVNRSYAGTYTCIASNGIGKEAMASIQVTVQYQPYIDVSKSNLTLKSWNGNSIRLRCLATGLPAPRISWYKPTNQQITTGANIVPGGSEVTVLTTADRGDYGQYKCRVTNILGSDEHVINVTQLFPPEPVTITIIEVEASSIIVRWTKPADNGGSPVTGYKVEVSTRPPVITVNTHTVITGLKANTQYTVKVYARNVVGYGQQQLVKVITTKKQGEPDVPCLTLTLDKTPKLSIKLTWTITDDKGGKITKYSIYMKEDIPSKWIKMDDIMDISIMKYTVTKNIQHGKTYQFVVTAWNKYGESAKGDNIAKKITTPMAERDCKSAITGTSNETESKLLAAVIVIAAILIVALALNVFFIFNTWRKRKLQKKKVNSKERKTNQQANVREQVYDSSLEMMESPTQQKQVPVYDTVELQQSPRDQNSVKSIVNEIPGTTNEPSHYQELSSIDTAQDNTRPVYEPLRTGVPRNDNDTNMYQPLGLRNQCSDYQTLHAKGNDSFI